MLKKLEQINPKSLWSRTLTDREINVRLSKSASVLSELTRLETFEGAEVGGQKNHLESKLREVEQSKSFISQLQSWDGTLESEFLLTSHFRVFFKELGDDTLQQAILMHMGSKLLEDFCARGHRDHDIVHTYMLS